MFSPQIFPLSSIFKSSTVQNLKSVNCLKSASLAAIFKVYVKSHLNANCILQKNHHNGTNARFRSE